VLCSRASEARSPLPAAVACSCGCARSRNNTKVSAAARPKMVALTSIVTGTKWLAGRPRPCAQNT
jgi:hypothetical protein